MPLHKPAIGLVLSKMYVVFSMTTLLPQIHFNKLLSFHLRLGLPRSLFPLGFPTKTLYAFLDYSICATCPAHLSRLDLRLLIMFGEEYNACSSTLCNFLHSPVISSFLAPSIFLSTLFSNTFNQDIGILIIILMNAVDRGIVSLVGTQNSGFSLQRLTAQSTNSCQCAAD